jgi:hypothetical protein
MPLDAVTWLPALVLFVLCVYWIRAAQLLTNPSVNTRTVVVVLTVKCAWALL